MTTLNIATHPELAGFKLPAGTFSWTRHATERSKQKQVCQISAVPVRAQVVECEIEGSVVRKVVARYSQCSEWDAVLVLVPGRKKRWTVLTCWLNHRTDTHKTLNYARVA